jgi:hypothetical protein
MSRDEILLTWIGVTTLSNQNDAPDCTLSVETKKTAGIPKALRTGRTKLQLFVNPSSNVSKKKSPAELRA